MDRGPGGTGLEAGSAAAMAVVFFSVAGLLWSPFMC